MEKKELECGFCGGKTELKCESLELLNGKVVLKQQPYYKCKKCKKEFVSSEQMKETEKQINTFYVSRPIVSTGRSLAITIPTDLAKFYDLKKGEKVQLIPESRHSLKVKIT
ncbi:AbrB/MazE/SpoVT family DNA-binding domain-containing protein [Candidatus Micrarchaeota archaeon]|nr:AbrB/MazE/SpoVT family DNA-binding domain-containing protein [Candidatus Micrarchaeota archaeon]MBU2477062.1 AbrB/MazE/SpoVT family DNA-binding domain-containing protein [Candidatus Micrarchaeota archaeon]